MILGFISAFSMLLRMLSAVITTAINLSIVVIVQISWTCEELLSHVDCSRGNQICMGLAD